MQPTKKNATILRSINPQDDYLRVTGQADAHDLARYLARHRPDSFAWEDGSPTTRYARSLRSEGGIALAFGRRNQDGLNAPQSDSRDSRDFMLEVPGYHARDLLPILREYPAAAAFQCPRRDICITARFDPQDCEQVYSTWRDLLASELKRPAYRLGPDGSCWESVSLQTHPKQAGQPRFAILYDKHAQNPAEYPDLGTLRFEFRFQPDKQHQKRALFTAEPLALLFSWRLALKAIELLLNAPQTRSFAWTMPKPDDDLETMTRNLLASYAPTLRRGLHAAGPDYLRVLALAALLQANDATTRDEAHPVSLCAPQAADYPNSGQLPNEAKANPATT